MSSKKRNQLVLEETSRLNSLPHCPFDERLPMLEDEWNE